MIEQPMTSEWPMDSRPFEIVLASASPRRAALLRQVGLTFRIHPSALDEDGEPIAEGEAPEAYASRLALAKAVEVADRLKRCLVIGADTVVVCDGRVLGKPRNRVEAHAILLSLAARTHRVITSIAVVEAETRRAELGTCATIVRMRAFDAEEAARYVDSGEPLDKAGAYGIQGQGALLVEEIQGDYFTVVGLPLVLLAALLRRFGFDPWRTGGKGDARARVLRAVGEVQVSGFSLDTPDQV
jgi:septum formation protein